MLVVNPALVTVLIGIVLALAVLCALLRTWPAGFLPTLFVLVLNVLLGLLASNLLRLNPSLPLLLLTVCVLVPASEEATRSFFADAAADGLRTAGPISLTLGGVGAIVKAAQSNVAISQQPVQFGPLSVALSLSAASLFFHAAMGLFWTRLASRHGVAVVTIACVLLHAGTYAAVILSETRATPAEGGHLVPVVGALAFFLVMYGLDPARRGQGAERV